MGLDMYLYLKKYEGCSRYAKGFEEKRKGFYPTELEALAESQLERGMLSKETSYEVGYWRKANAIHKWFVDHCGGGRDDCKEMYVSIDDLEKLIGDMERVIEDHGMAEASLPTQSGFFFGSTDYDEWYFDTLERSVKMLKPIAEFMRAHIERLKADEGLDWTSPHYTIAYRASW